MTKVCLVVSGLLVAAALTGCDAKQNKSASVGGRTGEEEAQRVAEKFADLLISKCEGGYTFGLDHPGFRPPPHLYATPFNVKAKSTPIPLKSAAHFYGYEWYGYVEITRPELGDSLGETGYEISKRAGQWFFRPEGRSGEIPIDTLQAIRPECPK